MAGYGMQRGTATLTSVGPIVFGPDDVLFVADNGNATVLAIAFPEAGVPTGDGPFDFDSLDVTLGSLLGCAPDDVVVRDLAVHPRTGSVYLAVNRGRGDDAVSLLVRLDRVDGSASIVELDDVAFSQVAIANAPDPDDERTDKHLVHPPDGFDIEVRGTTLRIEQVPARQATITDLAYVDGLLLVAGMSNEEFASNLRRIPFPFTGDMVDNSLEIFHVSHGAWETAAPVNTFVPYDGGRSVLASYTCTPVVHFSFADLASGTKATGRTVAELGSMNTPLDIVAYRNDHGEHLLVSNTHHGLLKLSARDIDAQDALTEPNAPIGVPRVTVDVAGVTRMANLGADHVLVLQRDEAGTRRLRSLKTSSL